MDEGTLSVYAEAVLDVVDSVPPGHVTTYGRIAALLSGAGLGGSARSVGSVMAVHGAAVAWWRVCPVDGSPPAHPQEAVRRWVEEGTPVRRSPGRDQRHSARDQHHSARDQRHSASQVRVDVAAALSELRLPGWVGQR